jgi:hypothetical protein
MQILTFFTPGAVRVSRLPCNEILSRAARGLTPCPGAARFLSRESRPTGDHSGDQAAQDMLATFGCEDLELDSLALLVDGKVQERAALALGGDQGVDIPAPAFEAQQGTPPGNLEADEGTGAKLARSGDAAGPIGLGQGAGDGDSWRHSGLLSRRWRYRAT